MLTRQISSECVHNVSVSGDQKPQFLAILTYGRLLYQPPFTDEGQIWCFRADPWYTLICHISSRSVYAVALWRRKTQNFAVFWTSAFCGVASWRHSEKFEHWRTTTNLPLSNGIKIVSAFQRLHSEIGPTISDVQKRHEQTDRQTKTQRFWPPRWRLNPSLTKLGTVIDDIG